MRKLLFVLAIVGLAVAGADSAMAQRPCDPYCESTSTTWAAEPAGVAPLFAIALTALVAPRLGPKQGPS